MALRTVIGTVGIVLGIMGVAVGMVGVGEVIQGVADGGTYGAMVLCFGLGAFAFRGGHKMLRGGDEEGRQALGPGSASDPESIVLALAAQGGGRVTVAEVAAKSALSIEQATETLLGLSKRGMADSIVTDDGVVIYQIPGLLSAEQKALATDILDS